MALQQQWREQLDQTLGTDDTALLQQKGVLKPAIPQPSCIRGEAGTVVSEGGRGRGGGIGRREREVFFTGHQNIVMDSLNMRIACRIIGDVDKCKYVPYALFDILLHKEHTLKKKVCLSNTL